MRKEFINSGISDWMQPDGLMSSVALKTPVAGGAVEDVASSNGTGVSQAGKEDVNNANGGAERSSKPVQCDPALSGNPEKKNGGMQ